MTTKFTVVLSPWRTITPKIAAPSLLEFHELGKGSRIALRCHAGNLDAVVEKTPAILRAVNLRSVLIRKQFQIFICEHVAQLRTFRHARHTL
jgi:hypothetical protein